MLFHMAIELHVCTEYLNWWWFVEYLNQTQNTRFGKGFIELKSVSVKSSLDYIKLYLLCIKYLLIGSIRVDML